ncbi:MAG: hypothetical protein JXR64_09815, partial [Spirochaetales bacterium]|nr:hypothetical protein [Spirochaetales bacterium]
GNTITIVGNWDITTFNHGTSLVEFITSPSNITATSDSEFYDIAVSSSSLTLYADTIINRNITNNATLIDGGNTITLTGTWGNTGTFTATGTFQFDNNAVTSNITGSTSFNIVANTIGAAGKTIIFEAGTTQSINQMNINGTSGNLIILQSSIPGTRWYVKNNDSNEGNDTNDYLHITDSEVSGTSNLSAGVHSYNNGNNDISPGVSPNEGYWLFQIFVTWNGSSSSSWNNPANWTPNSIPAYTSDVTIPDTSGLPNIPHLVSNSYVNSLTMLPLSELYIDGYTLNFKSATQSPALANNGLNNSGTIYRDGTLGESVTQTDPNSGTVVYIGTPGYLENYPIIGTNTVDYYNLIVNGAANLQSNVNVQCANNILINNTLNGAFNVILQADNSVIFENLIGNITPPSSLTVTTPVNTGDIVFKDSAVINGNVTLIAGDRTLAEPNRGGVFSNNTLSVLGDLNITGTTYLHSANNTTVGGSMIVNNLYISSTFGVSVTGGLTANNVVLTHGNINLNGSNFIVNNDLVILGSGYNTTDPDTGLTGLFDYNNISRTTPVTAEIITSYLSGYDPAYSSSAPFTTTFSDLVASTITVSGNFYNNGASLTGSGVWNFNIPDNNTKSSVFAETYNSVIQNSVANYPVSAAENNTITTCTNWFNTRPTFDITATGLATVYDDVIRVKLSGGLLFENSENEISSAVSSGLIGVSNKSITGSDLKTYKDPECTIGTDGAGDLSTFYIRVENSDSYRWNTDATGLSPGMATSTDRGRSGIAPVTRTTVPNLVVEKASASVFLSLQDSYKNRIEHRPLGSKITDIKDNVDPVIISIDASKHNSGTADTFDGHNYFEITFSENINYNVNSSSVSSISSNTRSSTIIQNSDTTPLGYISQSGTNVNVSGLFNYPGSFVSGSFDSEPNTNALYTPSNYKLRIDVAGYKSGTSWPGYLGSLNSNIDNYTKISNPSYNFIYNNFDNTIADLKDAQTDTTLAAQLTQTYRTATILGNTNIVDNAGNPLAGSTTPYDGYFKNMNITGSGWDVFPPYFSKQMLENGEETDVYEIYFLDQFISVGNRIVDNIAFHLLDNHIMQPYWISWTGWNKGVPSSLLNIRPDPVGGLRDINFISNPEAFKMGKLTDTTRISTPITGMTTSVDTYMFRSKMNDSFEINTADDLYFSIQIDESQNWLLKNQMNLTYDSTVGKITDYAGNLLPNSNSSLDAFQWIPPNILLSLGIVNDKTLYIQYTKDVYANDPSNTIRTGITKNSFTLDSKDGNTISNILAVDGDAYDTVGKSEFFITLANPLSANDMVHGRLITNDYVIYDRYGTDTGLVERRLSDLGIGLVTPVYGTDSIHKDGRLVEGEGSLKDFDGTGRLMPEDVIIATQVGGDLNQELELQLLYDIDTDLSAAIDYDTTDNIFNKNLWLPEPLQGTYIFDNLNIRTLNLSGNDSNLKLFSVPNDDAELMVGGLVQFIYKLGASEDLYCVSIPQGGTYLSDLIPWEFNLEDLKRQRGGVTILNNVINPLMGQKTELIVEQDKPGKSIISVFSIDGTLVKTIQNGRLSAGEYRYLWDGTNKADKPVARGVYFIKVIAPGINESRKVMIVK